MSLFRKDADKGPKELSTASLPDIVFMLLFFFMATTKMRTVSPMVQVKLPNATELSKVVDKELMAYIYVGKPQLKHQGVYGSEAQFQLNDKFAKLENIESWVETKRKSIKAYKRQKMKVSIKGDANGVRMGKMQDIKMELRKANALKVLYAANGKTKNKAK